LQRIASSRPIRGARSVGIYSRITWRPQGPRSCSARVMHTVLACVPAPSPACQQTP
jgi:hypothetical protein